MHELPGDGVGNHPFCPGNIWYGTRVWAKVGDYLTLIDTSSFHP